MIMQLKEVQMKKIHLFPKAYKALNFNPDTIELKLDCTYLDGFGRKIKIYDSVAWKGIIFYTGKYINQENEKILDDMDKNAECKFLKNGHHFLYYGNEWDLIKEI